MGVIFHHLCHIPLVKNKSHHTQGKRIIQGHQSLGSFQNSAYQYYTIMYYLKEFKQLILLVIIQTILMELKQERKIHSPIILPTTESKCFLLAVYMHNFLIYLQSRDIIFHCFSLSKGICLVAYITFVFAIFKG